MKKLSKIALAVMVALGLSASVSLAQDTEIGGDATAVGLVLGDQTAIAAGFLAEANNNAGAIMEGTKVGGDATAVGLVLGDQTAIAAGFLAKANNNAGVIGAPK